MKNESNQAVDERLMKPPKYKIGDVVVYLQRHGDGDGMNIVTQSKIIESHALIELGDRDDELGWFYHTEETDETHDDNLTEADILYKL